MFDTELELSIHFFGTNISNGLNIVNDKIFEVFMTQGFRDKNL